MARQRINMPPATNPQLRGWTAERAALTDLIDVTIRSSLKDPQAFTGLPRPLTGIDFLEKRERKTRLERIVAKANPQEV